MPAPQPLADPRHARPVLGHVNLMVDTFLANANVDDLRAIVRGLLSSSSPGVAAAFTTAAQRRLVQSNAIVPPPLEGLFVRRPDTGEAVPTPALRAVLMKARMLYGAGMGFASLRVLAQVVRASALVFWAEGSEMERTLAEIDADISQALQSSREEMDSGRMGDIAVGRAAITDLKSAVKENRMAVESWGGDCPFERAEASLDFWKL